MALNVGLDDFKEVLRTHFTPSRPISHHEYLLGRDEKLKQIDRAFNSPGKHVFIHGDRGVGKTSLARSAVNFHQSSDSGPLVVECESASQPYELIRDIVSKCIKINPNAIKQKETVKFGLPGLSYEMINEINQGIVPNI